MSKIHRRDKGPRGGASVEDRLARLLDTPSLARIVPHLPPETLHQLIRSRGLEACTELVTSATPAQLTSILDLDLWRHPQPGRDEQFDVDRFGEWLETLVEAGDSVAARIVATLDKDVVIVGLSRYVRVFDAGIFEPVAQSDDEAVIVTRRCVKEMRCTSGAATAAGSSVKWPATSSGRGEPTRGTRSSRCWPRSTPSRGTTSTP